MSNTLHQNDDPLAWSADTLRQQLGNISRRHLAALNASGRIPKPIKLGRRTIWRAEEIRAWLRAGAPSRDRWEQMKSTSSQRDAQS